MIIDGHAHSCGDFLDANKIIETIEKLEVNKVILCPGQINDNKNQKLPFLSNHYKNGDIMLVMNKLIRVVTSLKRTSKNIDDRNEFVYQLSTQYPERILQFLWVNPNENNVVEYLRDRFISWKYRGIKVHQCSESFKADAKSMYDIAEFAGEKNIPIFIHLYSKKEVKRFISLALENPNTIFIVAHLIGFEIIKEYKEELDNVYFEISPAPLISQERLLKAINIFGASHIILGSDTPYGSNNLKENIEKVKKLKISEDEKVLILGENMRRILRL